MEDREWRMKEFIVRDLRENLKKNILLLFAITISIALAMGMLILQGTMSNRISILSEKTGAESTIVVTSEDLFGEELIEKVRSIDEVVQVEQQLEYATEGEVNQSARTLWLLGVAKGFETMDKVEILDGRSIEFSSVQYEMLVDSKVANEESILVGDEIKVSLNGEEITFKVVGIYKRNRLSMQPCYEFYVDGEILQNHLNEEGRVNKINVRTSKQNFQTISRVTEEIQTLLGENVVCETINERKANASRDLNSFSMILGAVLAIFIFGSVYLIYSAFCVRMDERIKTIAVFKTLGANEKQIKEAFLKEGLFIGVTGGILGVIVGILVGGVLCYFYAEKDYSDVAKYFTIKLPYVMVCVLLGVVVCYLGSIRPIKRIAKISPIAAMKDVSSQQYKRVNKKKQLIHFWLGIGMLGVILVLSNQVRHIESEGMIYFFMVFLGMGTVIAMLLMVPYVIRWICRTLLWISKDKDSTELYLATQNLTNNRNNTTLITSIIITGIMIIASLHGMFSSARESVGEYVSNAFAHDYLASFEAKDYQELDEIVETIEETGVLKDYTGIAVYNYKDELSGKTFRIFGVEPEEYDDYSKLKLYSKQKEISFKELASNENICFVSRQIMIEKGYRLGDTIKFVCDGDPIELTIAASFNSFTNDGRLIYMSADHLKQINKDSKPSLLCLNKADNVSADEFEDIVRREMSSDESSILSVKTLEYTWKDDVIKGTEIFYFIFAMITMFVLFTLINNYITSILQRKSEIGMFFSLGARSKNIKRIFTNEMLLQYVVAILLGVGGSYVALYIFVQCLSAVFHADLRVYYPIEIMITSSMLLMLTFIILNHLIIKRILKINVVELIKERSI